jgi:hypothetical protein
MYEATNRKTTTNNQQATSNKQQRQQPICMIRVHILKHAMCYGSIVVVCVDLIGAELIFLFFFSLAHDIFSIESNCIWSKWRALHQRRIQYERWPTWKKFQIRTIDRELLLRIECSSKIGITRFQWCHPIRRPYRR